MRNKTTIIKETVSNDLQYIHSIEVHSKVQPSPLSKESPNQNYRGLANLAILYLAVTVIRMVLDNYLIHGLILSVPFINFKSNDFYWLSISLMFLVVIDLITIDSYLLCILD
jgi:hypothetical protein